MYAKSQETFGNYVQLITGADIDLEMVSVNGGTFTMGSPESELGRKTDEEPMHKVLVDDFWIGKFEITWDLYEKFLYRGKDESFSERLEALGIEIDGLTGATQPYIDMSFGMGKEGFPAINITQYAALSFCKWLSAKTGRFFRLPTEAEWEYTCKKGMTKSMSETAWFGQNSSGTYKKTGQKIPNSLGIHDMLGNVAEWTMDQYLADYYSQSPVTNPWAVPNELYPRVIRGGSWQDSKEALRCSARRGSKPQWKQRDPQLPKSKWWFTNAPFAGFRVLRPGRTPSPAEIKKYWLEAMDDFE